MTKEIKEPRASFGLAIRIYDDNYDIHSTSEKCTDTDKEIISFILEELKSLLENMIKENKNKIKRNISENIKRNTFTK